MLVESVVRWWIDNFPEAPLQFSMPHLGAMADAAVVKANAYNITNQPDVCAFALSMWLPLDDCLIDLATQYNVAP